MHSSLNTGNIVGYWYPHPTFDAIGPSWLYNPHMASLRQSNEEPEQVQDIRLVESHEEESCVSVFEPSSYFPVKGPY